MNATCNLCKEFTVPWDEIGKELMDAHLKEKHRNVWKTIHFNENYGRLPK
jgi:hypothetical protein